MFVCLCAWAEDLTLTCSKQSAAEVAVAAAASTFSLALAKRGVKIATIFWLPSAPTSQQPGRR